MELYVTSITVPISNRLEILVFGTGITEHEAKEKCTASARSWCTVNRVELRRDLAFHGVVHVRFGKKILKKRGLLILVRCYHDCGEPYDYRFFAVPFGEKNITSHCRSDVNTKIIISKEPTVYSFLDCNGYYSLDLPERSLEYMNEQWGSAEEKTEFTSGAWVPIERVGYTY